ncbi:MAG: CRISPR-associated helicase Cas3' [Candidatus Riflebacteria bacterium]|nr:CRISPR-associated helicase Cas3' [Candidatus Riflebacteria bacterium]
MKAPLFSSSEFIAHVRKSDREIQTVESHLLETSEIAGRFAEKLGLSHAGALIGLLHDFGKLSSAFQSYIKACVNKEFDKNLIDFDVDQEFTDFQNLKRKVDHSTAGAQWIHKNLPKHVWGPLCSQIMNLCVVSHHSGLIDCLDPDGKDNYKRRIEKVDEETHFEECYTRFSPRLSDKAIELHGEKLILEFRVLIKKIFSHEGPEGNKVKEFYLGCLARCLFSCLIDADRISSADFEEQKNATVRSKSFPNWDLAIERFERFFKSLKQVNPIDKIRKEISDKLKSQAGNSIGVYTLTVPTGGGKTFSSLRYALHHAKKHNLERIFYIIPYTSIIEQNASEIRKILEEEGDDFSSWVLEHHSNLESEQQTWQSKLIAENWDAPIVVTTMVQFLEAWFGSGTRSVRRLHQMARSVLIFDEVQTLPIKCVHMFCNSMNFLSIFGKSTVILCTATQPVLSELKNSKRGQLRLSDELVGNSTDVARLFDSLERVEVINKCREPAGWSLEELTELSVQSLEQSGSCLVIVNTKAWAKNLYLSCKKTGNFSKEIFHLSTNLCPAHRKEIFRKIKERLEKQQPVLCVSTQLIEAGVDISFNSVIRFLAGFDSIAQAAGRCNRHGTMQDESGKLCRGKVFVVNPEKETIKGLEDIMEGQRAARRVFSENPDDNILKPEIIRKFFDYYFFERSDSMIYPFKDHVGYSDSIFNLLSDNPHNNFGCKNDFRGKKGMLPLLMQSFATANKYFAAIDAPTESVIVPYGEEGRKIIASLCGQQFDPAAFRLILRDAQKYSVNVFPNVWDKLRKNQCIYEVHQTGIYYLDEQYYNEDFGLATEKVAEAGFLMI